ncbi:MAG: rRNA maturation RNase YbeY [Sebaldella sp.]|nr:rRNA maturation RNase YbeY [Sebaldella sp.]
MNNIEVSYDIPEIFEYMDEEKIIKFVDFILEHEGFEEDEDPYVSVLITTNEIIKGINKEYREKDEPTDVISFAYNETENIGPFNILGDIIISSDRVSEQASEYEHSEEREFFYVLCHGILHLLGYDHIEEDDKSVMRAKEEEILEKFGYRRG